MVLTAVFLVYGFARDATTKYRKLGAGNNIDLLACFPRGQKSEGKVGRVGSLRGYEEESVPGLLPGFRSLADAPCVLWLASRPLCLLGCLSVQMSV